MLSQGAGQWEFPRANDNKPVLTKAVVGTTSHRVPLTSEERICSLKDAKM